MQIEISPSGLYVDSQSVTPEELEDVLRSHGFIATKRTIDIDAEMLKRICDNARAYGWEHGRLAGIGDDPTPRSIIESTPGNPFTDPTWDRNLDLPQGWQLSYKDVPL